MGFIHPVFHVMMLQKCIDNASLVMPSESVSILDSFSYEEVPVEILDR